MNRSCHKETMLLHNGASVRTRAQPHFIHLIWNCEIYRFIWEPFIVIISFVGGGVGEREVLGRDKAPKNSPFSPRHEEKYRKVLAERFFSLFIIQPNWHQSLTGHLGNSVAGMAHLALYRPKFYSQSVDFYV
ncbi:hypothetical protein CDAR_236691 [Caerostris darwini]|uniref:Uncharacterized protein n=1 Tax=Caerostris darwini TaxID=1538125 RepID=A0AAV4NJH6_9ARAC|nr:hypothetical protein CDAR_236691 [Caerostris darwini]